MNSLMRNKRPLYLCKKYIDEDVNVIKFEAPKEIIIDWQPISSDGQTLVVGIEYSEYIRVKGTAEEVSVFNNKDRVYIFKKPKLNQFDVMCNDAEYEVSNNPVITLNDGEVMLRRLSRDDEEFI